MAVRMWHSQNQTPAPLCSGHMMMPLIFVLLSESQWQQQEGRGGCEMKGGGPGGRQGAEGVSHEGQGWVGVCAVGRVGSYCVPQVSRGK